MGVHRMKNYIYLLFISMLPLIELRGAMIYAALSDLPFLPSLAVCVLGNILPVPFLIKFSKQVLNFLSTTKKLGPLSLEKINPFFQKIIDKGNEKASKIGNYELLGLFFFVAFPVPGTGAWMASLIAALLQLRLVKSTLIIFLGVLVCGFIMGFISFGLAGTISTSFSINA